MKWPIQISLSLTLFSLAALPCGAAVTNWVAYNDHTPGPLTAANSTRYNMRGVAGGLGGTVLGGNLTNFDTGAQLPVVITSSANGAPDDFGGMAYPNPGTPAYDLFNGKVDVGNAQSGIGIRASSGSTATLTFSNLDPSKTYTLKGTSVRGNNYTDRWTLATLMGADSYNDDHSAAVYTSANFPTGGLTAGQAGYLSGENRADGAVVGWTDISPGVDGTISVLCQQWAVNPLPNGAAPNLGAYGYAFCAVMLAEVDPSGTVTPVSILTEPPATLSVAQDAPFTLSAVAAGTGPLFYHWFKGGSVLGTTTPSYSVAAAALGDSGSYQLEVSNSFSRATTIMSMVTVHPDTNAPLFVSAREDAADLTVFHLVVNEPLNQFEAEDTENWRIGTTDGAEFQQINLVMVAGTNITFFTTSDRVQTKHYRINLAPFPLGTVSDRYGNYMVQNSFIDVSSAILFKQGVNGYAGTRDTELRGAAATTPQGGNVAVTVDTDDGGGISHGLLRFEDVVGNNAGQVPIGAVVSSAILTLQHNAAAAEGDPVRLHRMLVDWDAAAATYASFVAGVQADDVEARTNIEAVIISAGLANPFTLNIDVTASVQAWVNGDPNYGWAFLPTGTGGYRWDTSEASTPPALSVSFTVPPCSPLSILTQPAANTTVSEGSGLTLAVVVSSPGCPARYQWVRNGTDIPGATGASYNVPSTTSANSGMYRVRLTNDAPSSAISSVANVTVNLDTNRPVLTRAVGSNSTTVELTFSKRLEPVSAQNAGNYTFIPALNVSSAALVNGANSATVTLTTDPRAYPSTYRLRISGVTDDRSLLNPINPDPTFVSLTAVSVVEAWNSAPWAYATNTQDGLNWTSPGFVTGPEWLSGFAFFGTEPDAGITNALPIQPNPIVTPITPNSDAANPNVFVTAYFRRQVTLPSLPANTAFAVCHWTDDGAVFHLDGAEIGRFNMPSGVITFTNKATAANEASLQCLVFTADGGNHTFAVDVHQGGATTSSDMVFGAEIRAITLPLALTIALDAGGNVIVRSTADSAWRVTSAPTVLGPYTTVVGPSPGTYTIPPASQAAQLYFRLQYLGTP